jgi:hypothetical protein
VTHQGGVVSAPVGLLLSELFLTELAAGLCRGGHRGALAEWTGIGGRRLFKTQSCFGPLRTKVAYSATMESKVFLTISLILSLGP